MLCHMEDSAGVPIHVVGIAAVKVGMVGDTVLYQSVNGCDLCSSSLAATPSP